MKSEIWLIHIYLILFIFSIYLKYIYVCYDTSKICINLGAKHIKYLIFK
jgi:hypothetical protein